MVTRYTFAEIEAALPPAREAVPGAGNSQPSGNVVLLPGRKAAVLPAGPTSLT